MAGGPLRDIRVIELSQIVAGPLTGSLLADLGADVIRIDQPGRVDVAIRNPVLYGVDMRLPDGRNALWETVNRNKTVMAQVRAFASDLHGVLMGNRAVAKR